MAQTSWPFENVDTSETQFSQWARNIGEGVKGSSSGTELKVTAGTGLQVAVGAGQAMVRGHYYSSTVSEALTLTTAHATNGRIDNIVLELDPAANSILLKVVAGTPSATPTAPALTQTDAGIYQLLLATVLVPAASTTVSTITDSRTFLATHVGLWATSPATPTVGLTGFNTTTALLETWTGTEWKTWAPSRNRWFTFNTSTVTPVIGHANAMLRMNLTTGITVTIPADVFNTGDRIDFLQIAASGAVTFAAGSGLTLLSKDSKVQLTTRYSACSVVFYNATTAYLIGDLA
jgi:hypothetical protein